MLLRSPPRTEVFYTLRPPRLASFDLCEKLASLALAFRKLAKLEDDSLSNTRVTRIVDDKTTKPASKGSCVLGLSEDSAALIKVGVAGCG